jgi:hypothetical protein
MFFLFYLWGYCGTKSTITAVIYWPIVPGLKKDDDNCGAISGMNEWQGIAKYRREPLPIIYMSYDLIRARTRAAVMRSQRLTAWATAASAATARPQIWSK